MASVAPPAAMLAQLRHKTKVYQGKTWWYCSCSCGYASARRATEIEAVKTAIHHAKVVFKARRDQGRLGVSVPLDDGPGL